MKKLQTLLFALMMITVSFAGCTDLSSIVDSDSDSIVDAEDLCPDTDVGAAVDLDGCADNQLDDDGDLVMNDVDLCPTTPAGALVDATGCEVPDADVDGITDADDLCPDTDVGATVDTNGCADNQLDEDGDLVMNDVDLCPNTPAGANVDATGCEVIADADGDGVADSDDLCPDTDVGATIDTNGCADNQLDDDGDLVMNDVDQCPNTPAGTNIDSTGCEQSFSEIINDVGNITGFHVLNGEVFFFAYDQVNNERTLWKDDSTLGPVLVKTISSEWWIGSVLVHENNVYFSASDGINGYELWKGDGTASGTSMVIDINSGSESGIGGGITAIDDTLYFTANDGTHGYELWKSDGTAAGTMMVKDINSGADDAFYNEFVYYTGFTVISNTLYFQANDGVHGRELWKSDGTDAGTMMVKDINIGTGDSNHYSTTVMGNNLYFTSNDGINGYELWVSDGTTAGTIMVKDINSGSGSSSPNHHTVVDSTLYFQANSGNGFELWMSDGTSTGTIMVKNINSGTANYWPNYFLIGSIGNTLYFTATDVDGPAIWESDGTTTGTVKIVSLPNYCYSGSELVASGKLYCLNANSDGDLEGWVTDITVQSSKLIMHGQLHNLEIICDYDAANTYGYTYENWSFIHGNEQYLILLDANAVMSLVKISI